MPMRIFSVKNGSYTEQQIKKLIDEGIVRLPMFEKEMAILDFCLDLDIIEYPKGDNYVLMVSGYLDRLKEYTNDDLNEITKQELNLILPKGKVINFAGTHELVEKAGYLLKLIDGNYSEVVLV
ncbi:hypothetical protein P9Y62_27980 [Bacillus thuringiensis]|uniref:hypothetical protein n=1 Tax=Bacillus thuringiensis TaxID=1428 RepID=UPI0001A1AC13|nr:hypothetical protein [Bacillus thuringiensis]EEM37644.1 hypothetical protein bthur0004_65490 [Bacillus thuringiensis serovar sotto str. T04001]MEB4893668.1 hypothetical protein [Bacillus thuringiensis]MEC2563502.1 hypothetical protein [Bacillus thuringiensis]MEC2641063.1 hypothetical protein [Bacillus thuringiensis]MEC2727768.1 hypothetical protein [Bacillus thuringiensis]